MSPFQIYSHSFLSSKSLSPLFLLPLSYTHNQSVIKSCCFCLPNNFHIFPFLLPWIPSNLPYSSCLDNYSNFLSLLAPIYPACSCCGITFLSYHTAVQKPSEAPHCSSLKSKFFKVACMGFHNLTKFKGSLLIYMMTLCKIEKATPGGTESLVIQGLQREASLCVNTGWRVVTSSGSMPSAVGYTVTLESRAYAVFQPPTSPRSL